MVPRTWHLLSLYCVPTLANSLVKCGIFFIACLDKGVVMFSSKQIYNILRVITLFIAMLITSWGVAQSQAEESITAIQENTISFKYRDCPFGIVRREEVLCGVLKSKLEHNNPQTEPIDISVVILKAKDIEASLDPIFYLEGGPGGSASARIRFWLDHPLSQKHDIVLVDQRGTGYSTPSLNCNDRSLDPMRLLKSCYHRLIDKGIKLQAFNSAESAADVERLRHVMGYESINLYGVSYGTRMALTIMRDHPNNIRSVVLDSTYPPEVNRLETLGNNAERAFEQVFILCERDTQCNKRYPKLRSRFFDKLKRFDSTPLNTIFDEILITGDDIASIYFQGLYVSEALAYIPYSMEKLIEDDVLNALMLLTGLVKAEEMENGQLTAVQSLNIMRVVFSQLFVRDFLSEGLYFSVECQEDAAFQNEQSIAKALKKTNKLYRDAFDSSVRLQLEACDSWELEPAPAIENEPIVSDIPTLVLAGSFDPVTPPTWGKLAAKRLENVQFIEFPDVGHGIIDSSDCANDTIDAFISNPNELVETTCVKEIDFKFYSE